MNFVAAPRPGAGRYLGHAGDLYIGEKFAEEQRARRAQAQGKRLQ